MGRTYPKLEILGGRGDDSDFLSGGCVVHRFGAWRGKGYTACEDVLAYRSRL